MLIRWNDSSSFSVNLFQKFLLPMNIVFFYFAERLNCLIPNLESCMQWEPLYAGQEFRHQFVYLLIIANCSEIDLDIILLNYAHGFKVSVLNIQATAFFRAGVRPLQSF
jgi:hypothetical protein